MNEELHIENLDKKLFTYFLDSGSAFSVGTL